MSVIRITPSPAGYALRLNVTDAEVFKGLVGALKRHVPSFARRFDSFEKCWHVEFEATADLKEWLKVAKRRRPNWQINVGSPVGTQISEMQITRAGKRPSSAR